VILDLLTTIREFFAYAPRPLPQLQGGGNCANALTGASRLGLRAALVTKIGADSIGDTLIKVPSQLYSTALRCCSTHHGSQHWRRLRW